MQNFSVKKPYTVIVSIILCLILGFVSFSNMTTDLLPKIELPYAVIYTSYPGATSEKVERTVTDVIEQTVATSSGIKNITSTSSDGTSMVVLQYEDDTNMDSVMVDLNSRISMAEGYFDDAVSTPYIIALNPNMLPVMEVAFSSDLSRQELSDITGSGITPEIEKIDGTASVSSIGLLESSIEVKLNQKKIDAINDKLLQSVDQELYDAQVKIRDGYAELDEKQKELNDGKAKIQSGKDQLSQKTSETISSLADASASLSSAQSSLEGIVAHETDLTSDITGLNAELSAYSDAINQLNSGINAIDQALLILASIDDAKPVAEIIDELQASPHPESAVLIQSMLDTLTAQGISAADAGTMKSQLTVYQNGLRIKLDESSARKAEIEEALRYKKTELTAAQAVKSSLNDKISQLNTAIKELEKGKLTASIQIAGAGSTLELTDSSLTSAQAQMDAARTQLDDAQTKLSDSKKAAYEKADISSEITPKMISQILAAENFSMPAGTITSSDNQSVTVRVGDQFSSLDELQDLLLFHLSAGDIGNIKLSDVADISMQDNADDLYAKLNGNDGIILSIQKTSTASTSEVCAKINQELEALTQKYPDVKSTVLFDQGVYINMVVSSVLQNLLQGGILALLILLLFLRDWKPTIIISFSIPISLLVAITVMYFDGITLNVMSLGGLALGVGMLVDNSIVVIENIYRLRKSGMGLLKASVQGAGEVSGAIFASTLTTVCVFVPIVFATGIARQFFVDMGLTIAFSLLASLAVALTVVPMMSSKLLKRTSEKDNRFIDRMTELYGRSLRSALHHKAVLMLAVTVLFVWCTVQLFRMPTSFIPSADAGQMTITLSMNNENSTAKETQAVCDEAAARILSVADVEDVGAMQSGSTALMSTVSTSDTADLYIILKDKRTMSAEEIAEEVKEKTSDLPCTLEISSSVMDMSALGGSGITINLRGSDMDSMYHDAEQIQSALSSAEGIASLTVGDSRTTKEKRITVQKNQAMEYGLTVAQVYSALSADLSRSAAGPSVTIDSRDYPIRIVHDTAIQSDVSKLNSYTLSGSKDQESTDITLGSIADIADGTGSASISHENQQRTIPVSITLKDGYNIGIVSKDVEKTLSSLTFSEGVSYDVTGENKTINDTMTELAKMIALALVMIYLI
ncbi:MAG: acriflavin resistance protein, partial [Erysipelotrichia bacterium]|nr:acriflavin resistance protein [Erysipelotrichia bacterium]